MPFRITGSFCQERVTRVYNKLIDFFVPLLMFVLVLVCVRVLPFRLRLFFFFFVVVVCILFFFNSIA